MFAETLRQLVLLDDRLTRQSISPIRGRGNDLKTHFQPAPELKVLRIRCLPCYQRQDIFVHQLVGQTDLLPPKLDALAPYLRVPELVLYPSVNLVADLQDAGPVPHYHRLLEVGVAAPPAHVNPDKVELLVELLLQGGQVHTSLGRDRDEVVVHFRREFIDETSVHEVHFVHDHQGGDVDAVAEQDVDELFIRDVLSHEDPGVVHIVDAKNVLHQLLAHLGELDVRGDRDASRVCHLYRNVRWLFVDPDSYRVQLSPQDSARLRLKDVHHEEYQVSVPRDRQDPLAEAPPGGGALDYPWEVEELNPGPVVVHDSRDDLQRRELVGADLRLRVRQPVEKGRLTHTGESDQDDGRIPRLLYVEPEGTAGALRLLLLLLPLEPRQLRLQEPHVVLRLLVDLRPVQVVFYLFDLLRDSQTRPVLRTVHAILGMWRPVLSNPRERTSHL